MRKKMIQAPTGPQMKTGKPPSEFEAFDALATKLLKVPKSAVVKPKDASENNRKQGSKKGQ